MTEYPLGLSPKIWPAAHMGLACGTFCFIKNSACSAFFSYQSSLNQDAVDLIFLITSTDSLVVKMIPNPILSDHNDIVCTKQ